MFRKYTPHNKKYRNDIVKDFRRTMTVQVYHGCGCAKFGLTSVAYLTHWSNCLLDLHRCLDILNGYFGNKPLQPRVRAAGRPLCQGPIRIHLCTRLSSTMYLGSFKLYWVVASSEPEYWITTHIPAGDWYWVSDLGSCLCNIELEWYRNSGRKKEARHPSFSTSPFTMQSREYILYLLSLIVCDRNPHSVCD
jgi:hypothetical protein